MGGYLGLIGASKHAKVRYQATVHNQSELPYSDARVGGKSEMRLSSVLLLYRRPVRDPIQLWGIDQGILLLSHSSPHALRAPDYNHTMGISDLPRELIHRILYFCVLARSTKKHVVDRCLRLKLVCSEIYPSCALSRAHTPFVFPTRFPKA